MPDPGEAESEAAPPSTAARSSPDHPTDSTSMVTREPVIADRVERTRALAPLLMGFAVALTVAIGALPPIHGWQDGRIAATAAMVLILGIIAWVLRMLRNPGPSWDLQLAVVVCTGVPLSGVVMLYEGVFSPAPVIYVLILYAAGQSDNPRVSWGSFLSTCGTYLVLSVLVISDVFPGELANFSLASDMDFWMEGTLAFFVLLCLVGTFRFARLSRRSTLQTMAALDEARQKIRRRDDMLAEARNALQEAVGKRGHLSGREVGPYVLGNVLGRGGMGEVYRAQHVGSESGAAVKIVHPSLLDPQHLARFLREAEVTAKLDSPHVVKVLGSGETDDGIPYLAMELLEGHDLAWHLRNGRMSSHRRVLEMIEATATALGAAHEAGVVHRDLKPSNLFLTEDGTWKVLDFGVSKLRAGQGTITRGAMVGTPGYMSPEQARSKDVDHRADIFALGAIAYRALTGRRAFRGEDAMAILMDAVGGQPTQPSTLAPLHPDVDAVLAVALAKKASQRFESAAELASALSLALAGGVSPSLRERAEKILRAKPWGSGESDELDQTLAGKRKT